MIKSTFLKNVIALFKGNVVFQITIILTLIFLAKHYTPSEIGEYAVFVSIISIISTIAPGRLEMAIMLPKKDKIAYSIYKLSSLFILSVSLIFLLISYVLYKFSIYFTEVKISFIPLLFFGLIFAAFNLLQAQYLNRLEKFKAVSNGKIITAIMIATLQVLSVYFYKSVKILAFSYMFGFLVSTLYYYGVLYNHVKQFNCTKDELKLTLYTYQKFPTINNLSSLFNIVANQGPVIFLEIVFGSAISGFYSVVQKTLNAPASLIGTAFSQVFYKKITKDISGEALKKFMLLSLRYLSFVSIAILVTIMLFSDFLYVFVFGEDYIISAKIARIMVVFFLVRLMFSSMSTLIIARNKLSLDLSFNIVYAISLLLPIFIGWFFQLNWITVISIITFNGTSCFLFLGYLLFKKI